jgi:spore coat polysaccharide biosynthesis predicted glycosyltransferase SpsG
VTGLKNKLLTVVTEGGRVFGFGHITRCLSISTIFKHYNFDINFIVNADDSISSILAKTTHTILNWSQKQQELLDMLQDSSFILIDSIQITNEQILNIQALGKNVIFIDDEKRRNVLDKGFVVDWTVLSDEKEHFIPKKENVTYLLGSNYTPLREEFKTAKQNVIGQDIKSIMLTFGGADVRELTPKILKNLVDNFPDIQKNIVIGSGFTNIKKIESFKDKNTNLIFNADTSTMVDLMQNNDLAIASGGQTLYELARIGTPTIAILLVENAKDDTEGWHRVGSLVNLGWYDNEKLLDNLNDAIVSLREKNTRLQMQNKAKKHINPNGALTLVDAILEKLK